MSFGSYYLIPTMFFFFEVGGGGSGVGVGHRGYDVGERGLSQTVFHFSKVDNNDS